MYKHTDDWTLWLDNQAVHLRLPILQLIIRSSAVAVIAVIDLFYDMLYSLLYDFVVQQIYNKLK